MIALGTATTTNLVTTIRADTQRTMTWMTFTVTTTTKGVATTIGATTITDAETTIADMTTIGEETTTVGMRTTIGTRITEGVDSNQGRQYDNRGSTNNRGSQSESPPEADPIWQALANCPITLTMSKLLNLVPHFRQAMETWL